MATITVPSDSTLPVAGAEIKAAPLKDWITNIRTFLEATNIDEANVDTSASDGIVGMSIAQTITGLKTFSTTSAAAGGLREVAKFEINPSSGTPANNDGLRLTFTADDAGGAATAIGYVDLKMTDASASSEDSEWRFSTIANASSVTPLVVNSTAITMTTTTVAIGTNATIGGGLTVTGTGIFGALTVGDAAISEAELEMLDGITAGTVAASKAVVVDSSLDIASFRNVTLTGELDAATLDISGNADIDGTTNLDAVDIDGAVQIDSTVSVGVNDQGYDVKFFGDTASAYLLWDTSADKLLTSGGAAIDVVKDKLLIGGTAVTTTAAELNILDGVTSTTAELNILDGVTSTAAELNVLDAVSGGTVTASLAVVVDSNKDIGSFRNITLTGELDAGSLDVSGDADIDGTLEADAITLGGTALGSLYSPIAGSGSIVTTGTVTSGTWSGVIDGSATMTLGSDATGDMYYRAATTGYLTRLASGADGTVLTGTGAGVVPAWESPTVGDITSVVAGSGMTGGATSGAATLNVIGGNGITANTDDVAITAAQTTVTSVVNAALALGRDADNQIKFATDDQIIFEVAGGDGVTFKASGEIEATTLDISGDADIDGTLEADAITLNGTALGSLYSPIAGSSSIATVGTVTAGTWQSSTVVASAYLDAQTAHLNVTQSFTGAKTFGAATQFNSTVTVGVDDAGYDVKFFGASAGAYMEYDFSEDQLRILGPSADAAGSSGKLLLATAQTDVRANDILGQIEFQAPLEAENTDARAIAAAVKAIAQDTFTTSVNATDLIFYTGHSEAATEKFRMTSQGELGVGGANYGTDGQVLTSAGAGAAAAWESVSAGAITALNNATESELVTVGSTTTELDAESSLTFDGSTLALTGSQTITANLTVGTDTFYVDNTDDGYIGIGNTNPTAYINNASGRHGVALGDTSSGSTEFIMVSSGSSRIGFTHTADTTHQGYFEYNHTQNEIHWAGGNFGIGNTVPGTYANGNAALVVGDTGDAVSEITIAAATDGVSELNFTDTEDTTNQGQFSWSHTSQALTLNIGIQRMAWAGGKCLLKETSNANMDTGLTINQADADDEIFALKSAGDVSHPFTALTEADTFSNFTKYDGNIGGVIWRGFAETGMSQCMAMRAYAVSVDDSDVVGSVSPMIFSCSQSSGDGAAAMGTGDNMVIMDNAGSARFILKGNGTLHITNTTLVAIDEEDDIGLVRAFQKASSKGMGIVMSKWDELVKENEEDLRRVGVLSSESDFIIQQNFNSLIGGSVWQLYTKLQETKELYEDKIAALESRLLRLEA